MNATLALVPVPMPAPIDPDDQILLDRLAALDADWHSTTRMIERSETFLATVDRSCLLPSEIQAMEDQNAGLSMALHAIHFGLNQVFFECGNLAA